MQLLFNTKQSLRQVAVHFVRTPSSKGHVSCAYLGGVVGAYADSRIIEVEIG